MLPRHPHPVDAATFTGARSWPWLAGLLIMAGISHFARPRLYRSLIPPALGRPDRWIYASGAVEIAVGSALVPARSRRLAGLAAAALFVVVFPGNLQMAYGARHGSDAERALTLLRLPIQPVLVWWALRVARRA